MPRSHVELEPDHLQAIAQAFDLGAVTAWQHTGKVYRLHAQAGTFALRFNNTEATRTHVEATQIVRRTLAAIGFPTAAPISASDGTTIIEWNGLLGELQPWIAHTTDGSSWANVVTAATALRHMHDHLADCSAQPDQRDDPWRTPAALAERLAVDAAALRHQARQVGVVIDRHLDRAATILGMLHASGELEACAQCLTHGDFQGPNLLFHEHALAGIIDFERLEIRPRLYDLAWPLIFWRWFGAEAGAYTNTDWRYARDCCDAYATAAPAALADREWATLPLLMAYIPARGVAMAAGETQPIEEILAFARALDFALWLVQHPHAALARLSI
jgi:Ser/Thr protein kinase RdoA (MazF antagonist)